MKESETIAVLKMDGLLDDPTEWILRLALRWIDDALAAVVVLLFFLQWLATCSCGARRRETARYDTISLSEDDRRAQTQANSVPPVEEHSKKGTDAHGLLQSVETTADNVPDAQDSSRIENILRDADDVPPSSQIPRQEAHSVPLHSVDMPLAPVSDPEEEAVRPRPVAAVRAMPRPSPAPQPTAVLPPAPVSQAAPVPQAATVPQPAHASHRAPDPETAHATVAARIVNPPRQPDPPILTPPVSPCPADPAPEVFATTSSRSFPQLASTIDDVTFESTLLRLTTSPLLSSAPRTDISAAYEVCTASATSFMTPPPSPVACAPPAPKSSSSRNSTPKCGSCGQFCKVVSEDSPSLCEWCQNTRPKKEQVICSTPEPKRAVTPNCGHCGKFFKVVPGGDPKLCESCQRGSQKKAEAVCTTPQTKRAVTPNCGSCGKFYKVIPGGDPKLCESCQCGSQKKAEAVWTTPQTTRAVTPNCGSCGKFYKAVPGGDPAKCESCQFGSIVKQLFPPSSPQPQRTPNCGRCGKFYKAVPGGYSSLCESCQYSYRQKELCTYSSPEPKRSVTPNCGGCGRFYRVVPGGDPRLCESCQYSYRQKELYTYSSPEPRRSVTPNCGVCGRFYRVVPGGDSRLCESCQCNRRFAEAETYSTPKPRRSTTPNCGGCGRFYRVVPGGDPYLCSSCQYGSSQYREPAMYYSPAAASYRSRPVASPPRQRRQTPNCGSCGKFYRRVPGGDPNYCARCQ